MHRTNKSMPNGLKWQYNLHRSWVSPRLHLTLLELHIMQSLIIAAQDDSNQISGSLLGQDWWWYNPWHASCYFYKTIQDIFFGVSVWDAGFCVNSIVTMVITIYTCLTSIYIRKKDAPFQTAVFLFIQIKVKLILLGFYLFNSCIWPNFYDTVT